jgi:hypothetical protein
MMKTKANCWWLLALPVLAVTACGEGPIGPGDVDLDPAPSFAKPGGKPGGGGKPSGDIPLSVTFADGTDGIRSDGDPVYVHGVDFVSARIRTNGMFYFQAFDGKRRDPVLRGVEVDLSSLAGEVRSPHDLADFQAAVGDTLALPFTSDVTLHTRDADGGMFTMEVDSTLVDGGKIGFNDYGGWEWRLLFDTRAPTGVATNVGLCATHPDENTWHLTADGAACGGSVDGVTELWRVVDGVFTHVADFNTPMHLTLTTPPS